MARATKKQRNKDSSAFKDAVDKSAELDDTGVVHEDGGPVYIEKLSDAERAEAGELLADKLLELAEVEQDYKDTSAKFRKDIKGRKRAIVELRDEVHEGMRKRPAQQNLPQVQGGA